MTVCTEISCLLGPRRIGNRGIRQSTVVTIQSPQTGQWEKIPGDCCARHYCVAPQLIATGYCVCFCLVDAVLSVLVKMKNNSFGLLRKEPLQLCITASPFVFIERAAEQLLAVERCATRNISPPKLLPGFCNACTRSLGFLPAIWE